LSNCEYPGKLRPPAAGKLWQFIFTSQETNSFTLLYPGRFYKNSYLEKFWRIFRRVCLALLLLLLALWLLLQMPFFQNWLAHSAAKRLGKALNTTVRIQSAEIGFFNKLNLQGVYVEDQHKDTLLSAGLMRVNITDWFFLADSADLKYVKLKDARVNLYRKDSVWNYQFLADFFKPSDPKKKTGKGLAIHAKVLELENVRIEQRDEWRGKIFMAGIGRLYLQANRVDFNEGLFDIREITIDRPVFRMYKQSGLWSQADSTRYWQAVEARERADTIPAPPDSTGTILSIKSLKMSNGLLQFYNRKYEPSVDGLFDARDIIVTDLNGSIKNLSFLEDTLRANVELTAKERSGLEIKKLLTDFTMTPNLMEFAEMDLQTNESRLKNYYAMHYRSFDDMEFFIDSVKIEARLQNSIVSMNDIAYFSSTLKDKKQVADLTGMAIGTISDFKINGLDLRTGKSRLVGSYSMKGLTDIEKTIIQFETPGSQIALNDVAVWAPQLLELSNTPVGKLGVVNYQGNFSGTVYDFTAKGYLHNDLIRLRSDFSLKMDGPGMGYKAVISDAWFDGGKLFAVEKLGTLNFHGVVSSNGFGSKNPIAIKGDITRWNYAGYEYKDIKADAIYQDNKLTAGLELNDENLSGDLQTTLDFNKTKQRFNGSGIVFNANMKALGFMKDSVVFSGEFDVDFQGKTIDGFLGHARFYNAKVVRNGKPLNFDSLVLQSDIDTSGLKRLTLQSNEADAIITGKFNIRDLKNGFQYFLNRYYPAIINAPKTIVKNQDFSFIIHTRNVEPYLEYLDSSIHGLNQSKLEGSLNTNEQKLLVNIDVPVFGYKNLQFTNAAIKANGDGQKLGMLASIDNIFVNDSLNFPNVELKLNTNQDTSHVLLSTSTYGPLGDARINAHVYSYLNGFQVNFNESSIIISSKKWTISEGGSLAMNKGYLISQGLTLRQDNQLIQLQTTPSDEGNWNNLKLKVENLNLGDLLPYVLTEPRMEGLATGTINVIDPLRKSRVVQSDIKVEQFVFNNDSVGIVSLNAEYNGNSEKLVTSIKSANKDYDFNGDILINLGDSVTNQINATLPIRRMRISILEKYLNMVFDEVDGFASGDLKLSGKLNSPYIVGKVLLEEAALKVGYTKCVYKIDSTVLNFGYNYIDFGNTQLKDEKNRKGLVQGRMYHHFFDSLSFNIRMQSEGMSVLNTASADNDLFYGKAVAKCSFDLTGPVTNLNMRMTATPTDSSHIYISTESGHESGEADFVVFKTYGREMETVLTGDETNLNVSIDLNANPLCRVDVILDEITGDIIKATGTGNLKITTGTTLPTVMRGRYSIERGSYDYTFQTLIRKPFVLSPDDENYIEWTGDPMDAILNVRAKYEARKVSMSTLVGSGSANTPLDQEARNAQGDVNIIAIITGRLTNPEIDFEVEFAPGSPLRNNLSATEMLKQINEDEGERLRQVTYLIIFKSFAPYKEGGSTRNPGADLAVNTISDLISREMAKILTNVVQKITGDRSINVDINTNFYNSSQMVDGTTTSSSSQYDRVNFNFNLNRAYFNNRVVFNVGSDFDVSVRNTSTTGFQFLPDISVEFILTSNRRLRGIIFKRDNLDIGGRKNRAGASISYRKDFDKMFGNKKDNELIFVNSTN
jgi:hypothetical protein